MKEAIEYLEQSIEFADSCGNFTDHQWASHSEIVWFGNRISTIGSQGYWLSNFYTMPNWENARKYKGIERSFVLRIK